MPLFMDRHEAPDASPEDVYAAHLQDLKAQEKFGVRYLTYWVDHDRGNIFCLVDAPNTEAAEAVHREAHGLVANEIIPVNEGIVESFLGRLNDPEGTSEEQPISDSAFRTIVFTDIAGSTELTQRLGDDRAMQLLRRHDDVVRTSLNRYGGFEVKHTGDGIMASFASATRAIESCIEIQRKIAQHNDERAPESVMVRVGLSAGEPVADNNDLFGAAVQLARRVCDIAQPGSIFASNVVRELCIGKGFEFVDRGEAALKGFDDPVRLHEVVWLTR